MRSKAVTVSTFLCLLLVSCGGGGGDPVTSVPPVVSVGAGSVEEPGPTVCLQAVKAYPNLSFASPVMVTHPEDNSERMFVLELGGTVRVFDDDPYTSRNELFLDISDIVETGEGRGLVGLAFHPNYISNGFFYLYYSASTSSPGQDHRSVISRFRVSSDPNRADPNSEEILLSFDQPDPLHNGGCLVFGPDGKLYVSSGDGGLPGGDPQGFAQDLSSLLGKILRLNDDGSIPADNPLVGMGGETREEIWAYGLRNPWRMSFDPTTGSLWAADVGEERVEEINVITRGGNFGWNLFEGNLEFRNPEEVPLSETVRPIFTYGRDQGGSITGGFVYRGRELPGLENSYLYGDFLSDRVWALQWDGENVADNRELVQVEDPVSFGTDSEGEPIICSLNGDLYRLELER